MDTYTYTSINELQKLAEQYDLPVSQIALRHEMETAEADEAAVRRVMDQRLDVFYESVASGLKDSAKSVSGLVGCDAKKLIDRPTQLLGAMAGQAAAYAVAISEANAKMYKIVACPTAGSCGIVPAVLLAAEEALSVPRQKVVDALFTAAGIGAVIARNACVAGAIGGCQAECGTAAAMAAGALTELAGGTPDMVFQAMTLCLKNVLGLACDPVAGLVEVPCVKRNGFFAVHAITAAEMAMAGIRSVIPPDEVIEAMYRIGLALPTGLKETAEGGLAATPTGRSIQQRIEGK
jgi:L-serine dehydratase